MTRGKRAAAAGNVGAGICLVKDLEAASFGPFLLQVSKVGGLRAWWFAPVSALRLRCR